MIVRFNFFFFLYSVLIYLKFFRIPCESALEKLYPFQVLIGVLFNFSYLKKMRKLVEFINCFEFRMKEITFLFSIIIARGVLKCSRSNKENLKILFGYFVKFWEVGRIETLVPL